MGRVTNDRIWTKHLPGALRRKIVLAQMDAVRTAVEGDVGPIVDDHFDRMLPCKGDRIDGLFVEITGREALAAKLKKARTSSNKLYGLGTVREARKPDIGNGINFGQSELQKSKRGP